VAAPLVLLLRLLRLLRVLLPVVGLVLALRIVVGLLRALLGGRIDLIPAIVKGMSALAGAVIPAAGFFAFRDELSVRERWLVVLTLAVNPIIWKSSAYGNSAIVATAMATTSLVVLSNRAIARLYARERRILELGPAGS